MGTIRKSWDSIAASPYRYAILPRTGRDSGSFPLISGGACEYPGFGLLMIEW
jgi:hypothetical protein